MEFRDLVIVLSDFGLWEKVAGCYEGEDYLGDDFLEEHIRKYSTSVFGKGKYSIRTDKNPEPGINCLASNVRVLQPVTSSGENDQMTMMN
ncbi:MAG: hypothetical protein GYA55_11790 [SAR324 cluster bacterium]|uniref:Uncharacterized protein n=1 Tax=SAR324 cluster bacterium TaxID=2024889 RepID=A0A7X9IKL8_9DELT|nr:hypothetical protein [SAR324 cluster bacterium]